MLNILTSGYKDVETKIYIDKIPELKHPKSILVGGGGLKNKYTNYLEEYGFDNVPLLKKLAQIYNLAKEKESIALVCDCRLGKVSNKQAHSEVIKDFILKHQETFDTLLPYLFTNQLFVSKTQEEIDKDLAICSEESKEVLIRNYETTKLLFGPKATETTVQLSDEDKHQIAELIKIEENKNKNEASNISDAATVIDVINSDNPIIENNDSIKRYPDFESLPDPSTMEGQTVIVI